MPHYWERHTDGHGDWKANNEGPSGADLAALRRGIGREPGTVPSMWPFYTTLVDSGAVTTKLRAEHIALTLFAVHQQSQAQPMHHTDHGLGIALRAVRNHQKFSEQAVDRRFAAAATATSPSELALHLRGLISQLSVIRHALDYTTLMHDLRDWAYPESRGRVMRRWGAQYFVWSDQSDLADQAKSALTA